MSHFSKSVPSVPGENGNTVSPEKQNASYKYDFVINNYTEIEMEKVKLYLSSDKCAKGGFGEEVGESGTPHLQGYISLKVKQRITGLKKVEGFERASFRPVRNEKALLEYFQKDGKVWSIGLPKPVRVIQELFEWQKDLETRYLEEPDDRTINWYWNASGNIGKSAFIKYMIVRHKVLFCSGGKHADIMNLVFNQDMDVCRGVFFDIPRAHKGHISYASLESIKNGMVCNTKYETGVKVFNSPHIFVFANFAPDKPEEMSEDRWNIVELF